MDSLALLLLLIAIPAWVLGHHSGYEQGQRTGLANGRWQVIEGTWLT